MPSIRNTTPNFNKTNTSNITKLSTWTKNLPSVPIAADGGGCGAYVHIEVQRVFPFCFSKERVTNSSDEIIKCGLLSNKPEGATRNNNKKPTRKKDNRTLIRQTTNLYH